MRRGLREVIQHAKYVSDEENSLEEDIDLNMKEEVWFYFNLLAPLLDNVHH